MCYKTTAADVELAVYTSVIEVISFPMIPWVLIRDAFKQAIEKKEKGVTLT